MATLRRSPLVPVLALLFISLTTLAVWPDMVLRAFDSTAFVPHGICILWDPRLVSLHLVMDLLIGLSYIVIAAALVFLVIRLRRRLPFHWTFLAFGGFIFFCGTTHFVAIVVLYEPIYWFDGLMKALTALASATTAMVVVAQVPQIQRLFADMQLAAHNRAERDTLYEQQQRAVEHLQATLASKEHDLFVLLDKLQQSEARFRLVLHGSPTTVFMQDRELQYTWAYNTLPQLPFDNIVGLSDNQLFANQTADHLVRLKQRVLKTGSAVRQDVEIAIEAHIAFVDLHLEPALNERGEIIGVLGTASDITERKQLERQLMQAQKMESIGRLAGGVAHDFNNLLTIILGHLDLVEGELPPTGTGREDLTIIRSAADRAAAITRQLLTFARKQSFEPQLVDLNTLLSDLFPMLQRIVGTQVLLRQELTPDQVMLHADPTQIQQIVLNLVINARDAITATGTISLATAKVFVSADASAASADLAPGRYVRLLVADSGSGIAPEHLAHIFEPFFTTKPVGKGTGLGLAICYGIAHQHGGAIRVESEPGYGTQFSVYLPHRDAQDDRFAPGEVVPPQPGGAGRVLLVEDETGLRSLISRVLRAHGYAVWEAANGRHALAQIQAYGLDTFDLLVTDVMMPELGGRAVADHVWRERPDLPVLFMTGYSEHTLVAGDFDATLRRMTALLVEKPFPMQQLLYWVRQLLERRGRLAEVCYNRSAVPFLTRQSTRRWIHAYRAKPGDGSGACHRSGRAACRPLDGPRG
ncbi:response regulator [Candidatus Gracilibacteria bacterium]|nr:response regulator [Candidatus Gracilibacteria bacterium]